MVIVEVTVAKVEFLVLVDGGSSFGSGTLGDAVIVDGGGRSFGGGEMPVDAVTVDVYKVVGSDETTTETVTETPLVTSDTRVVSGLEEVTSTGDRPVAKLWRMLAAFLIWKGQWPNY